MSVMIDGQVLFDDDQLKIEPDSVERKSILKAVAGLDGILSIDLGRRGRTIKQKGLLRAQSTVQLTAQANAILALMDGRTHTLAAGNNQNFENLRMDTFKVKPHRISGSGVEADYEISYTQLKV